MDVNIKFLIKLFIKKNTIIFFFFLFLAYSRIVIADTEQLANQQLIYQQERQKALEEQLNPISPDIHISLPEQDKADLVFPAESPCFIIHTIELQNIEIFPNGKDLKYLANNAKNYCLGTQGINLFMGQLQNNLISHGYVTSRVVAPEQDLHSGILKLLIIPGRVSNIYLDQESTRYIQLINTLPLHINELLNLRNIEHGLENLQRIANANAEIDIIPAQQPGESDIEVKWQQQRFWRLAGSFDDSGSVSTGRYQAGLTFFLDNPLSLADSFYLSGGHDIQDKSNRGSKNYTIYYSVPYGYWNMSMTASGNNYKQTIAGIYMDSEYSGRNHNFNLRINRIIHRNDKGKTSLYSDISTRSSRNFINDVELEIQRRKTSALKIGLQHRHYFDHSIFDMDVSYKHGMRWFNALAAPEESISDVTALSRIIFINASTLVPFNIGNQQFHYSSTYQQQISKNQLTPQDRLSIGGRWSVRGFDGELNLSADNGWYIRNDLVWGTPLKNQELYIGVDYGKVSGNNSQYLLGTHLAGGVLGLQGTIKLKDISLSYDSFAGIPISKPAGFKTSPVTLGFTINWQY